MSVTLHQGDCLDVMRGMEADSVDAVVTDPPAGIGFMGRSWDKDRGGRQQWVAWLAEIMTECHRVMKPGAYALVWALPRTSHWTGWAIEDGGLLIQDRITHLFGSGFPKSKTHLKPAAEDWWLAYKPGKRALNIEACRIGTDGGTSRSHQEAYGAGGRMDQGGSKPWRTGHEVVELDKGRWPANITHDGSTEVLAGFPVTGPSSGRPRNNSGDHQSVAKGRDLPHTGHGHDDAGGSAARFFYCSKASRGDREEGLDEFDAIHRANGIKWTDQDYRVARGERPSSAESGPRRNHHPTVKPTELMRWLCRLVTPPGGIVLDPFMGSGSTGKAALIEGFSFVGIEQDAEYIEIARARIAQAQGPLFAGAAD